VIKLKRLKINRYRNVEPCDLVFSDRFNILLGPNGAGKTTLLNLISKVLRTNLGDTSDPFSIEIELSFPGGSLSGKIESFDEANAEYDELLSDWRKVRAGRLGVGHTTQVPQFELQVNYFEPASSVTVTRNPENVSIAVDGVLPPQRYVNLQQFVKEALLDRVTVLASTISHNRYPSIRGLVGHAARFDESLDTFRSITARLDNSTVVDFDLRPRILCEDFRSKDSDAVERAVISFEGVVPAGFLTLVTNGLGDDMNDISFSEADLPFLSETCRLLGLRAATAKLELTEKNVHASSSDGTYEYGNLKFLFTRKDGSIFQDQHLSYGQKRLLTFLYYLEANPSIIIADELVNGLHHAWIKECMEAIGERQAFLTSQNPLLLDYLFFTSVKEVKESFILCRVEPVGDSEKMIWRNLTDDEAAMFYSAYKVGIEHVGEILRTRGLW
jgi:energy-coupling factor transporter ATP-binding protein EcfA2